MLKLFSPVSMVDLPWPYAFTVTFSSSLADNFVLAVGISTRGDLLLRLQLLTEIPEPLSLVLLFTNVDTGATSERTIHDNSFTNALEINSQVDNSQLPTFQAFTVQVAMMVRGLRGPFNQPGTVLSKLVPAYTGNLHPYFCVLKYNVQQAAFSRSIKSLCMGLF